MYLLKYYITFNTFVDINIVTFHKKNVHTFKDKLNTSVDVKVLNVYFILYILYIVLYFLCACIICLTKECKPHT